MKPDPTKQEGPTMPPTPAAKNLPRPNPGPPHQIHRLREFLDREYSGTDVPGEHAADQAIRLFREHRDAVDPARALASASGITATDFLATSGPAVFLDFDLGIMRETS